MTQNERNEWLRQVAAEMFNRPVAVVQAKVNARKAKAWDNRPGRK